MKVLRIFGLVLLLASVIAGMAVAAGRTEKVDEKAITIVQGPDPFSLSPTLDINKTSYNIQLSVFDPLVKVRADGDIKPWLATSWRAVSPDTWEIKLRNDVKFHNGEPFNAKSVAFSINAYNTTQGEGKRYFQIVKDIKVVDDYTIQISTDGPNPLTMTALGFLFLFPPDYFTEVGEDGFSAKPVGTGPYEFVKWQEGVEIELKRNNNYWSDLPVFDKVYYKPAPEASTRISMLETGSADIIANVPPEMVPRVNRVAGIEAIDVPSLRILFVELNKQQPPFNDIRVRKAVNHAINKDQIISTVLGGFAERRLGVIPTGWLGYNPPSALNSYDYDPDRARRLLAEAGYPDGFQIDFWHSIGRYLKDREVAEAIAFQLGQVGIRTTMHGMDIGSLVQNIHTQKLPGAHLFSWAALVMDTDNMWRAHFYSQGLNQYSWDEKSNRIIMEGSRTVDRQERDKMYRELELHIVNDVVPWIFLYAQNLVYGSSEKIRWEPQADEVIDIRNIRLR